MSSTYQPIAAVVPVERKPMMLALRWKDGTQATVDLSEVIAANPYLMPLGNAELFQKARISPEGFAIEWSEELDLSSAQLWRWAMEQAGKAMAPGDFRRWMERHGLSLQTAADALGISRRMVAYYAKGEKLIPRTVLLACAGFEAMTTKARSGQRQRVVP